MWRYVLKRIGLAFLSTFIILTLTFILMKLLPFEVLPGTNEDRLKFFTGQVNMGYVLEFRGPQEGLGDPLFIYKSETLENVFTYFYKAPVLQQYYSWIKGIFTEWNWGTSTEVHFNISAITIIAQRLPISMSINVFYIIFSVPLGIVLGIIAALRKNTATDHVISTGIMIAISIPSFVLITLMIWIFGWTLEWLPTSWPKDQASQLDRVLGYIIPVVCLSFGSICGYARSTRAELCEILASDYLLLARTKGLTKRQAVIRHALKNAMVPIFPSILAEFLGVFSGSMILEKLYDINGIGGLFLEALNKKDYNVLLVDMTIFTLFGLLAGVLLDLSYGFLDPRIRMGAKK